MSSGVSEIYELYGRRYRSDVELDLPGSPGESYDVAIRWGADILDSSAPPPGEVIASYASQTTTWYVATASVTCFVLRFPNVGEFIVARDLTEVIVRRDPSGQPELLPILLTGTLSAFLLALSGETVLHASAVEISGGALAFVGQSGRGKSTLAALLCVELAHLVTDDVLVVRVDGGHATCLGGATELRLRPGSTTIADARPDRPVRPTADGRLAVTAPSAASGTLPLSAIIIPTPSQDSRAVKMRQMAPANALFMLLSIPRVYGWTLPEVLQRDFETLSRLVNRVPVFEALVPWGPPFDPAIAAELAALATR